MTTPLKGDDRAAPRIGGTFAGYRIEELAGRQRGIGRVYVATHLESERQLEFPPWPVALKVFALPEGQETVFRRRFEQTARRQAALHHPNVVSIYEVGVEPAPFLSMTLFRGPNLADLIASGELDDPSVLAIASCVAAALEAGHEQELVFRRLRPSSVLVASDAQRAFLGDFGAGRSAVSTELLENEQLGMFVDYISPEEVRGAEVSPASNVYSLAAIVFECLTGEPPFPRRDEPEALRARLDEEPQPLGIFRPDLPAAFESALKRALHADPHKRHGSPGELVKALRRSFPRKTRKRATVAGIGGMTAVAATPPLSAGKRRRRWRAPAPGEPRPPEAEPQSGARRKRRLSPVLLILAPLLVCAAVLGAVAAPSSDPEGGAAEARQLSSGGLGLRYPGDWRRTSQVPSVPGLALREPVALIAPAGAPGAAGDRALIAGRIDADDAQSLPSGLRERLGRAPQWDAVDLGAVQAYRYSELRPSGFDGQATLYIVPTSGDAVVLGCLAPSGAGTFPDRCERVASTLELRGETALALAPSPAYARALRRVVARLGAARRIHRERLGAARTRRGQAGAAERLALAYRSARGAAARLTPPPGARATHADIVRALVRADDAYRTMAAAARSGSRARWSSARETVRVSEERLQRVLEALRERGYDPQRPPA